MTNTHEDEAEFLIVGAGPVGLVLAWSNGRFPERLEETAG